MGAGKASDSVIFPEIFYRLRIAEIARFHAALRDVMMRDKRLANRALPPKAARR